MVVLAPDMLFLELVCDVVMLAENESRHHHPLSNWWSMNPARCREDDIGVLDDRMVQVVVNTS